VQSIHGGGCSKGGYVASDPDRPRRHHRGSKADGGERRLAGGCTGEDGDADA